jgi:GT2 family glycosyltransferase
MRLSVIILAHNHAAMTARCLQALAGSLDGICHEVWCVDNASDEDMSTVHDAGAGFARFAVVRNDQNLVYSVANNRAAGRAEGECLLFLNNDVEVAPGSLAALLDPLVRRSDTGVTGARLVYPGGGRLQHAGMEQMLWGLASNFGVGAAGADPRFHLDAERFAVTGAMLCIRRSLFERLGGFEESYAWGYEDVDLCLKVRRSGACVRYVAAAQGVHHESLTLRDSRDAATVDRNYRLYRERWDPILVPAEAAYLRRLTDSGIRRVVIAGGGSAARALWQVLTDAGIAVEAFTAARGDMVELCGRRVVSLAALSGLSFDRLIVGSQFYFEMEPQLRAFDPERAPIFPVLSGGGVEGWPCESR